MLQLLAVALSLQTSPTVGPSLEPDWSVRLGATGRFSSFVVDLAVSADRAFRAMSASPYGLEGELWLESLNTAGGGVVWSRPLPGYSAKWVDLELAPDGNALFVAAKFDAVEHVLRLDPATGELVDWVANRESSQSPAGINLSVSPDGTTIAVGGDASVHSVAPVWVVDTVPSLRTRWQGIAPAAQVVAGSSRIYVVEKQVDDTGRLVARYPAMGGTRWMAIHSMRLAAPIALAPDESVVVTGTGGQLSKPTTHAYGTFAGDLLWSSAIGVANIDLAFSADSDTLFYTGSWVFHGVNRHDLAALDAATGAVSWIERRDGLLGNTLSLSPDGTRILTRISKHGAPTRSIIHATVDGALELDVNDLTGRAVFDATGQMFLGTATGYPDGRITARSSADGSELWTSTSRAAPHASEILERVALTPGGVAFVSAASEGEQLVAAYRVGERAPMWQSRVDLPPTCESLLATDDGRLLVVLAVGHQDDVVRVLRGTDGAELWRRSHDDIAATLLDARGETLWLAIVGEERVEVIAVAARTGAELWRRTVEPAQPGGAVDRIGSLALSPDGTTLFLGGVGVEPDGAGAAEPVSLVVALDAGQGAEIWRAVAGESHSPVVSELVAVRDVVHGLVRSGFDLRIVTWNASDGSVAWTSPLAFEAFEGSRLVPTRDGSKLYSVHQQLELPFLSEEVQWVARRHDAALGTVEWESVLDLPPTVDPTLMVFGRMEVALSPDGERLFVLRRRDNEIFYSFPYYPLTRVVLTSFATEDGAAARPLVDDGSGRMLSGALAADATGVIVGATIVPTATSPGGLQAPLQQRDVLISRLPYPGDGPPPRAERVDGGRGR